MARSIFVGLASFAITVVTIVGTSAQGLALIG